MNTCANVKSILNPKQPLEAESNHQFTLLNAVLPCTEEVSPFVLLHLVVADGALPALVVAPRAPHQAVLLRGVRQTHEPLRPVDPPAGSFTYDVHKKWGIVAPQTEVSGTFMFLILLCTISFK